MAVEKRGKEVWICVSGIWSYVGNVMQVPGQPPVFVCMRKTNNILHSCKTLAVAKKKKAAWWMVYTEVLDWLQSEQVLFTNFVIAKPPRRIYSVHIDKWMHFGTAPGDSRKFTDRGSYRILSLKYFTLMGGHDGDKTLDSWY